MTLRPATPADALGIVRVLRQIEWFTHLHSLSEVEVAQWVSRHLSQLCTSPDHSVYVGEAQGEVLGYCSVHWIANLIFPRPTGIVSELFLAPAATGQGLGGRLLEWAVAEARQRGCVRLELINFRTRESYKRGFYTKQGWEEQPDAARFVLRLP